MLLLLLSASVTLCLLEEAGALEVTQRNRAGFDSQLQHVFISRPLLDLCSMSLPKDFILNPLLTFVLSGEHDAFDPLAMSDALKDSLIVDPSVKGQHKARDVLKQDNLDMVAKCKFFYMVHALHDCNDISKGFFNKLKAKKKLMHSLQIEDGIEISRPNDIMQHCENFYFDLLSRKKAKHVGRDVAIRELLDIVDPCIEQTDARRLEAPFEEAEVKYALSKLGNEKTPGICGISKEFVVAFWDELKDII
ncbi:hypothetical protein L7F22_016627 [Adiantum nelumboides]|nr:hypothetical protein [Adiantum nelumboides]